jgi:mRNA-degrading endonuclease RelE of RelBE toxin-antitoxin system
MAKRSRFEIIFDDHVFTQLDAIHPKDHSAILDAIEQQLSSEAMTQTRNRKPMRIPNTIGSTWELRCGQNNRYRVFYDVDQESQVVVVLAVGYKLGNRVFIGKEELLL